MDTIERRRILDAGNYLAGFDSGEVQLLTTEDGPFRGSCEHIRLGKVEIAWGHEQVARVAFVALRRERTVFSFPTNENSTIMLCGEPVRFGQLALHPPGAQFHERTMPGGQWGRIHVSSELLAAVSNREMDGIQNGQSSQYVVLSEPRLHHALLSTFKRATARDSQAPSNTLGQAVETPLGTTLSERLVNCLRTAQFFNPMTANRRRHSTIMLFQRHLAEWSEQPIHIRDICTALGVPSRTLEDYCEAELGTAPYRYLRLHRLAQVRKELLSATPATTSVTAVSRRYGFRDLGRFAATYRAAFDELPSDTLAHSPRV